MARYGQAFRDRIVARLLPPESAAIDVVSREVGVSVGTLERWRAQALAAPGELTLRLQPRRRQPVPVALAVQVAGWGLVTFRLDYGFFWLLWLSYSHISKC